MTHELGIKVRKIRELKNLSQDYVADKLSLSQGYYSDMETGRTAISQSKLTEIARILDVSPEFIRNFNDQVVFNSCQQSGYINTNNINPIDKINELYQDLLRSKDGRIEDLKKMIEDKNKIIESLKS